jgi:hypothetical protein
MTEQPSLAQLIKLAIDNRLLDVHTALIARVETYDAETQLVDVEPVLKRTLHKRDGSWADERLPMICDVPVLFPRAGGCFISFPIQPGDFVQLIFNEVDIEEWFDESTPVMTATQRFTLHGAVALPGIYHRSKALVGAHKANFVLGRERGLQIHIDDEKIRLGSADDSEALAIASKVREELDRIKNAFNNHKHVSSGGSIDPANRIVMSSEIAAKNVVAT